MKKLLLILFASLLTNSFSQTNTSSQLYVKKESKDQLIKSRILSSSITSFAEDRNNKLNINNVEMLSGTEKQDEIPNFYPLAMGNKWIYHHYHFNNGNIYHYLFITEVNGIYLQPNGELYYIWNTYRPGYPGAIIFYERIDSSSAKIYKYDENLGLPNDEYMIDDLLAEPGDTVLSYRFYPPGSSHTIVIKDTLFEKWGLTKTKRVFQEIGSGIPKPSYSLTQDVGLDSMFFVWDDNNNDTYILKGCVLNGIVYGDTITVGVDDEKTPVVVNFKLGQNYPNPFNPTTKIKFTISSVIASGAKQSQLVTLKVYDILGNEIATLVNEELSAGEYEVEFNIHSYGGQNLSSGVYFYQLRVGGPESSSQNGQAGQEMIQTKKMVYLK